MAKSCSSPSDVSEHSTITLQITEMHSLRTRNRVETAACYLSQLANQDEVSIGMNAELVFFAISNLMTWVAAGCDNNMFKTQMSFLGTEEAKRAYLEAFQKAERMENQPGLLEKAGKVGSAFKTLLDLGNLMAKASLDPTGSAEIVFSVCTKAWEHLEQQEKQDTELHELVKRVARTIPSAESVKDLADDNLKETVTDMLNLAEDMSLFILNTRPQGSFSESYGQPESVNVERTLRSIVSSDIQEQSQAYITKFEELKREFDSRVNVQALRTLETEKRNTKLRELKPADLAGYDPSRQCLTSTRIKIIDELDNWARTSDVGPRLAWVHGLAGLGKSSIATSVCLRLDGQHALASSFFCKRDSPELRDPRRVLTTIIYGLALHWDAYRDAIVGVISEDPELGSKHIQPLYDSLVSKPLQNMVGAKRPKNTLVVVVDALDECGDTLSRTQLLTCLRGMSELEPWLRLIVTSRPDSDIREFFGYTEADWYKEYNVLNYDALADVRILIENRLSQLTEVDDWPRDAVEQLSLRSNGLFIWAQTACRLILGGFDRNKRLSQVLAGTHISNSSADLDVLYTTAVKTSALDGSDDNMEYTMKCLGAVVVTATRTPLSLSSLTQLLRGHVSYQVLSHVLGSLSSVLYVDHQQDGAIRVSHPSFMDYITDPSRSKELCVDLEKQNTLLAELCFEVMNRELGFNMCALETSCLLNSDIPNLGERVLGTIRPHLIYSCLYWSSHVAGAQIGALCGCLRRFLLEKQLLYWIEALSLLGKLRTALTNLLQFAGCSIPDDMQDCHIAANDAYRFVLSFYDAISKSTPHLYISALAFAPSNSGIAQRMRPVVPKLLTVVRGAEKEWTPCLASIWAGSPVKCIAVSPNGRRVVSGSEDGTVRVRDAETGDVVLGPLNHYLSVINCVAFSPDGRWITSGSGNKTIQVWHAETGESRLNPLEGHSGFVTSVAFSPDSHRLVSGSGDETVRVWELETGQSLFQLRGYLDWVWSVVFSPDGRWILSGSWDMKLRIWDAQTGEPVLEPLCGHSGQVLSVAFSPDSHRIVSGSADKTIRIWDAKAGDMLLGPLQRHSDKVLSVAFSPDGRRIASGSADKTVRIWDAQTGDPVAQPLDIHSDSVTSVVFCPNGRVVSGSMDKTIRIWEVTDGNTARPSKQSTTSTGHSRQVESVAFSSDGRSLVSGSEDRTVRIWDVETGEPVHEPLRGHTLGVLAVAISLDGRWVASGARDATVRIWDAAAGKVKLRPLLGHSDCVLSVAFSPNSRLVISGSQDNTVRIWDMVTGQTVLGPLIGHLDWVMSVAFSPDGHRIASGSVDGSVRTWDSSTGEVITAITPKSELGSATSVASSPDGRRMAFGSHNGTLIVLDAETGNIILGPLRAHKLVVRSVVFSPDGRWIASASSDNILCIWDAQTGQSVLEPLQGHMSPVLSVAFSPDGRRLVSGSQDMSVRIWDVDPRTLSNAASPKNPPGMSISSRFLFSFIFVPQPADLTAVP
ncbi:hypothetical protein FRC09_006346 [Ceratobasidium sp. 395]|nr:hypothetical protein FRC09_006346 [Ceratobasidium sp. 395]